MKIYTIIENRIPIGFFVDDKDRDDAFHNYFILQKRWGIKGEYDNKINLGADWNEL